MPGNAVKLTMRTVDALSTENRDALFWGRDLPGFGVRVYRTGRKVHIVQARGPAGSKRAVIGGHGEIRADAARRQAVVMIDRIKRGEDPVPPERLPEPTVADLAARYLSAHVEVNCRAKTVEAFGRIVRLYIVPELGNLALSAVDRSHVSALHYGMRDKPYQANQTVSVLAKMLKLAEAWGMTAPRRNPCRSVRHYKEHRRERFLTAQEYRRLGRVLDEVEADGSVFPSAVPALRLLSGLPRSQNNPWVLPGRKPSTHLSDIDGAWDAIRNRAGLVDVRMHDLRHSFASRALALGQSLPMIGKLLGHRQIETTGRYAHLARESMHEAATRISDSIAPRIL